MKPRPIKAYRVHPDTGEDANTFDTTGWTEQEKIDHASDIRHGAKFYWFRGVDDDQAWTKVERANYSFVANVIGQRVEWID
jgi:hypothetical protein